MFKSCKQIAHYIIKYCINKIFSRICSSSKFIFSYDLLRCIYMESPQINMSSNQLLKGQQKNQNLFK